MKNFALSLLDILWFTSSVSGAYILVKYFTDTSPIQFTGGLGACLFVAGIVLPYPIRVVIEKRKVWNVCACGDLKYCQYKERRWTKSRRDSKPEDREVIWK